MSAPSQIPSPSMSLMHSPSQSYRSDSGNEQEPSSNPTVGLKLHALGSKQPPQVPNSHMNYQRWLRLGRNYMRVHTYNRTGLVFAGIIDRRRAIKIKHLCRGSLEFPASQVHHHLRQNALFITIISIFGKDATSVSMVFEEKIACRIIRTSYTPVFTCAIDVSSSIEITSIRIRAPFLYKHMIHHHKGTGVIIAGYFKRTTFKGDLRQCDTMVSLSV